MPVDDRARSSSVRSSPASCRPETEANVRAELGGSMLEVRSRSAGGQHGALLGRIETRTLEDARQSASRPCDRRRISWRGAARGGAHREAGQRRRAGRARPRRRRRANVTAAEAQVADAQVAAGQRRAAARRHRHPRADRRHRRRSAAVNAGDVVSPGTELFTSSIRRRCGSRRRCRPRPVAAAGRRRGRVHRPRLRHSRSRDESSASRRRPTRRRGRCRSTWRFRTSADGWWPACSPRAGW